MLHGQKEVLFVSIIMFILCPDALSLNGSVMINQSINQSVLFFLVLNSLGAIGRHDGQQKN